MKRSEFLISSALLAASTVFPMSKISKLWNSPFTELRRNVGHFVGHGNLEYGITGVSADVLLKANYLEHYWNLPKKG